MEGKTPHEAWLRFKPNVHYFHVFGYMAYAKETKDGLKKLDDRNRLMVMLGYETSGKAYRLFDPENHGVHVSTSPV